MAARLASLFDKRVLIERQADGDVYRLLFLDGQLLDIVRRRSPTVVGDGRSTIGDLIAAENRRRVVAAGARGLALLRLDLDCAITLREAGMSLASVPPAESVVRVKTATGDCRIEDSETYRGPVSERVIEDARTSASLIGARMSGIDVIAPDIAAPLQETGGVIAEVNGTPGLHHHYHVANHETATRVAVPVLRELLGQRLLSQPGAPRRLARRARRASARIEGPGSRQDHSGRCKGCRRLTIQRTTVRSPCCRCAARERTSGADSTSEPRSDSCPVADLAAP